MPSDANHDAGPMLNRELPHMPDAEKALLGSMLLEPDAIVTARQIVRDPGAFFFARHQRLFAFIGELAEAGKPVDGIVIKDELTRRGVFESVGGYEYLGELINSVASAARAADYAQIVWSHHLSRQAIRAAHGLMATAYDNRVDGREMVARFDAEAQKLADMCAGNESAGDPCDVYDEVFLGLTSDDPGGEFATGLESGYLALDGILGGFKPGNLVMIAARPSCGKTTIALNIAANMALRFDNQVLFVSLEMSRAEVTARVMGSESGVPTRVWPGKAPFTPQQVERLDRARAALRASGLAIVEPVARRVEDIQAIARAHQRRHGLDVVFVDYLSLLDLPDAERDDLRVGAASMALKRMAQDMRIPVVLLAQLNRKPEDRADGEPTLSDLRRSGDLEQDADKVILIHPNTTTVGYANSAGKTARKRTIDSGPARIIVAKNRSGPTGECELHFNAGLTRFENQSGGGVDYPIGERTEQPAGMF